MSERHLKAVTPPVDNEYYWRRLLNFLYLHDEDEWFAWLKGARRMVEEAEKRRRAG